MKMFDKNGNLTSVAREIFNSGLERMRSGESAIDIAKDLKVQVKLVKYEGPLLNGGRLTSEARQLKNVGEIYHAVNRGVVHTAFAREILFPQRTFDLHRPYIPGMVPPRLTKSIVIDTLA